MGKDELFLALGLREFDLSPPESRLCPVGWDAFSPDLCCYGRSNCEFAHQQLHNRGLPHSRTRGTVCKGLLRPVSPPSALDLNAH